MELERALGFLMLAGTLVSLASMALGISLYVLREGEQVSVSDQWVVRSNSFLEFVAGIGSTGSAAALLMRLGVAALMLTPYSRAVVSLIYFARRRDLKFVAITGLVVTVLSMLLFMPT
ncbi:MAG: DUF1634 domain-containing protein [Nitrososphaerota archaeon]